MTTLTLNEDNKFRFTARNQATYRGALIWVYRATNYAGKVTSVYYACYDFKTGGNSKREIKSNLDDLFFAQQN